VDTLDSGLQSMSNQSGIALGQASLTVAEQASMLATIDDYGVYHDAHVITSITRNDVQTPLNITTDQVFSPDNSQLNAEEATQVQYAMSADTASGGTAPNAAMSNGQEIIAKTGTTNTAQSAFFIGAIPNQTLAVALFTNEQGKGTQTLNNLGDVYEGGYGGTWPANIWHTFAENVFVPMGVEQFNPVVFTGTPWNELPLNLRHPVKHKKKKTGPTAGPTTQPTGQPNPYPYPTYSCDPKVVTCTPTNPNPAQTYTPPPGQNGNTLTAGAAVGGVFAGLPVTCLWVRRRTRKRGRGRG
jgi:membrane peptidoglycan carboxypeptidase